MCRLTGNREILNTSSSEKHFLGHLFLLTRPGSEGGGEYVGTERAALFQQFHSSVFMGEDVPSSAQSLSFSCLLPAAASLRSGHTHNRFPT